MCSESCSDPRRGSFSRVATARPDQRLRRWRVREFRGPKMLNQRVVLTGASSGVEQSTARLPSQRATPSLEPAGIRPAPRAALVSRCCLWMCARTIPCKPASKPFTADVATSTCSSTMPGTSRRVHWKSAHQTCGVPSIRRRYGRHFRVGSKPCSRHPLSKAPARGVQTPDALESDRELAEL